MNYYTTRGNEIAALHGTYNVFLPTEWITSTVVPGIGALLVVITAVHYGFFVIVDQYTKKDGPTLSWKRKVCYQMTNFVVNGALAAVGLYSELYLQPNVPYQSTVSESVSGFEQYYLLSCMQMAYQLWGLPVGVFLVQEQVQMLIHHTGVFVVAVMSCFLTNGFRYWTPFMYGVLELSSLPLAVMNTFKDHPEWIERYPTQYHTIRIVFCIMFLWIRVLIMVPRMTVLLTDQFYFFTTCPNLAYAAFMAAVWVSTAFLCVIQLVWARKIVYGMIKFFFFSKNKRKNGKSADATKNDTKTSNGTAVAAAESNGTAAAAVASNGSLEKKKEN